MNKQCHQLNVSVAPQEESMLRSRVQAGHYGRNAERALVVSFLKRYELYRPLGTSSLS